MQPRTDDRRRTLTAISNGIVAIHRNHFGRGSNSVRSIMHEDYVTTFLSDIFTPAERTLVNAGHFDQVRTARQLFHDSLAAQFRKVVEDATGRKVIAFFSQINETPDMAMEAFVLEPSRAQPEAAAKRYAE